jgi:hypothetical protein
MASSPPASAMDTAHDAAAPIDAHEQANDAGPPLAEAGSPSGLADAGQLDAAADAGPSVLCLAAGSGDFTARGPYGVTRETITLTPDAGAPSASDTFTLFSPEPLEAHCRHPFAAWANGTGVTGVETYAFYQEHAASWGIVVIAAHDYNPGPDLHARALDHLLATSRDPSSRFYQKLAGRTGAGGHAQGGSIASLFGATHPSVEAIVAVGPDGLGAMGMHAFLCLSGTDDIGAEGCRRAVSMADGPALAAIWDGGSRVITQTAEGLRSGDPGSPQMMRLYTAWYRCFLADDPRACALFRGGQDCGICRARGWAQIVSENL